VAQLIQTEPGQVRRATAELPRGVTAAIAELSAGTLVTLELHRSPWDRRPRRVVLNSLHRSLAQVVDRTAQVQIVAAALIRDRRVLAAQRSHPPEMAGKWEFPGGKVELGETPRAALIRECAEELGARVTVGDEIGRKTLDTGAVLMLYQVALDPGSVAPEALEHTQLCWADKQHLDELDWLRTNRQFVADVTARL
jgi:8-oxo-dGTP diphosphatase